MNKKNQKSTKLLLLPLKIPTKAQASALSAELESRSGLPQAAKAAVDSLPAESTHPMTQLSVGALALQSGSKFAAAYAEGLHKSRYWEPVLEDSLDLIAKLPELAARIYRRTYHGGKFVDAKVSFFVLFFFLIIIILLRRRSMFNNKKKLTFLVFFFSTSKKIKKKNSIQPGLDWAANLAHMMGFDDPVAHELMRLYQTIHTDHEGGNVSAHTAHVVGSALSDPYYSFAASMCGLAGPLHGLANQEVLRWLVAVQKQLGPTPSADDVREFARATLAGGKVVPGFGHAVLRKTDPRYTCQREFALKHMKDDKLFALVSLLYETVPGVLAETGKVKNPWPNVDAHSGVLLQRYGIVEESFYTVLFGVSRAIGVLSQGVWSRALGLPIERPKSTTMGALEAKFGSGAGVKA